AGPCRAAGARRAPDHFAVRRRRAGPAGRNRPPARPLGPRAFLTPPDRDQPMSDTPPGVWTAELDRRARDLAWLVLDVDGVLTDGRLHFGPNGELFKSFHVRDGLAIQQARAAGLRVAILSARSSAIVARRAAELGVDEVLQG